LEFFNRNAGAVQAISAVLTVLLALGALIGVKFQIDAAEKLQRAQSARDIYREYLNVSMSKPEFARPDYCNLSKTSQAVGYEQFVEYLLYTAEQTISVDPDWEATFSEAFKDHVSYLCALDDTTSYAEPVAKILSDFQKTGCTHVKTCN
jgi:hypothetical protein